MKTDDWESWKWQLSNSVKKLEDLKSELDLLEEEQIDNVSNLPLRITPYFLNVIRNDKTGVLRKTVVPTINEFTVSECESGDPLDEYKYKKTDCIIHKYPNRVLFLVSNFCSSYCRYCTRSRVVGNERNFTKKQWEDGFQYIRNHPEVRDVLISGGDPLTLTDSNIEYLLSNLKNISHLDIIRIGTKVPVVLPQRIDHNLIGILKKYKPIYHWYIC